MKSDFRFYVAVFLRRIHYFLAIFTLVSLTSVTVARLLPPLYVSKASLLVESPQIPDQLATATVNAGATEQLQIIEQRLMTRANLLEIAQRMNVFEDASTMTADDIVSEMRNMTKIQRTSGRGQATFMTISFESDRAIVAANVANEYVTLVLTDNVEFRTDRAGQTLEFFEQEAERLSGELADQSLDIIAFKTANQDALPETLDYRLNQQSRLLERLSALEREIALMNEQKRRLTQIFEATGRLGQIAAENQTPEQRQLFALQDELQNALTIYSPENPKIRVLESQITRQEEVVAARSTAQFSTDSPETTILDIQLAELNARISNLTDQKAAVDAELIVLDNSLARTSAVSIDLDGLERDYSNIQSQYNSTVARLAIAATGERIELLSKGQRIAILDAATVPSKPTKPNRTGIALAGTFLGFVMGIGLVAVFELLNGAVRRPRDIVTHLGITPLATIPYIRTPLELVARRAIFVAAFGFIAIGIPAILFGIHTYYLPLDLIYDRVADKIGSMF